MAHELHNAEDFAALFAAMTPHELEALRELPWQAEPILGEAVSATFSAETGLVSITGAMPFLETQKPLSLAENETAAFLRSEHLALFLMANRPLLRAYRHEAAARRYTAVSDYSAAHVAQVTADIPGVEAANFAVYLAGETAQMTGNATLVIDADPQNQFVFPLLSFSEAPPILTESLQKPSTFRADLKKCILPVAKNLSYLNIHASSLRPFDDAELARILSYLDADFENIVIYSGFFRSRALSANAQVNYAICDNSYKSELGAVLRHAGGSHTVLIKKGKTEYFPCLTGVFSKKPENGFWQDAHPHLRVLTDFIRRVQGATKIVSGGHEKLPGHLYSHTGVDLYAYFAGTEAGDTAELLNKLQKKLRAYYPRAAFFSTRSIHRNITNLPQRPATTLLEVGTHPQLVSLIESPELRAAAIFPAGILPAISAQGMRISACSADGFVRYRTLAARGGFTQVLTAPRYRLNHPHALAAIMEQVQA